MQGSSEVRIKLTQDYGSGIQLYSTNSTSSITNSGGSYYAGIRILWDRDGGITNVSWYINNSSSPFSGKNVTDIYNEISTNGNLNDSFSDWVTTVPDDAKDTFVRNTIPETCWELAWTEG